jgi:glutaminyl-peptide cyclotransferase
MRWSTVFILAVGGFGACLGATLATRKQEPNRAGNGSNAVVRQGRSIDQSKITPLAPQRAPPNLGEQAFIYASTLVSFGPRYFGQPGWSKQLDYIDASLKKAGIATKRDTWTDRKELITFTNISATIPGKRKERIVIACHHDTKCTTGHPDEANNFHFVGANDGASGVALLLALAPIFKKNNYDATIELVFFDGEESLDWQWNDAARALFGSKRYVKKHRDALLLGNEQRIEAVLLLDMVGRKDLHIQEELFSTEIMRRLCWSAAVATGHQANFYQRAEAAADDHKPFLDVGIPAVDLIDLNGNPTWHTRDDTLANMSPESLQTVADVVLTMIPGIQTAYLKSVR